MTWNGHFYCCQPVLNGHLSCIIIYVQGTMINWSTFIKEFMQTYIVIVSGSILTVSTVHLNGIWHLICRYLLKPELGGHPVLSRHYSIPRGCLLNTGFTVFIYTQLDLLSLQKLWSIHELVGDACPKRLMPHSTEIQVGFCRKFKASFDDTLALGSKRLNEL